MNSIVNQVFANLQYDNGIFYSEKNEIGHYPVDGNELFSQIEENSFWYVHRNNIIIESIRSNYPTLTNNLLEIGAGNGYVSSEIKKQINIEVLALEPDSFGAKHILSRGIKHVICSLYTQEICKPESVDNIGAFDVLEHIEDETQFLNTIYNSLRQNGKLFLTVPAYSWLWSIEDEHDKHFRRYTKYKLLELLKKNGFGIEYSSYFFSLIPLPIFFIRTLTSFFHVGSKKNLDLYEKNKAKIYKKEHASNNKFLKNMLLLFFKWEPFFIKKHISIPFGGSIIVVAKKNN